jgi:L-cysteine S-thiosulfotransferase
MMKDHGAAAGASNRRWPRWRAPAFAAGTTCLATLVVVIGAHRALPRPASPVDAVIAASWSAPSAHTRLWAQQDLTQRECTLYGNRPPDREAVAIMEREWRAIVYPADGVIFGDWQRGAELARNSGTAGPGAGQGARMAIGGLCAACHELEHGNVSNPRVATPSMPDKAGPALTGYGRNRSNAASEAKLLYEQIYSSNAVIACSIMPRFGSHNVLSPEQIRDIVAYLLSPESPVNAAPGRQSDAAKRADIPDRR